MSRQTDFLTMSRSNSAYSTSSVESDETTVWIEDSYTPKKSKLDDFDDSRSDTSVETVDLTASNKLALKPVDNMSINVNGPMGIKFSLSMKTWQAMIIVFMVIQNVSLVLMLHHVRARVEPGQAMFSSVTAILMAEVIKLIFCLVVGVKQVHGFNNMSTFLHAQFTMPSQITASLKTALPAVLYVVQSNLLYFAITYLSPVTYQITSQLKILTTAAFSILMLNRTLSQRRWLALVLLMLGVAGVQYKPHNAESSGSTNDKAFLGLIAIIMACTTSGFAGVWFEKILKAPETNVASQGDVLKEPSNLIANNLRLAFFSILVSCGGLILSGQGSLLLHAKEFFIGWNFFVWLCVLNAAIGGLTVAMVVKYTDNIAKAFATSCSIVVAGVVQSMLGWDSVPGGLLWYASAGLVMVSVALYQWPDRS